MSLISAMALLKRLHIGDSTTRSKWQPGVAVGRHGCCVPIGSICSWAQTGFVWASARVYSEGTPHMEVQSVWTIRWWTNHLYFPWTRHIGMACMCLCNTLTHTAHLIFIIIPHHAGRKTRPREVILPDHSHYKVKLGFDARPTGSRVHLLNSMLYGPNSIKQLFLYETVWFTGWSRWNIPQTQMCTS